MTAFPNQVSEWRNPEDCVSSSKNSKHFALLTPLTLGLTTFGGWRRTLTIEFPTITRLPRTLRILSITPTIRTYMSKFMTFETTLLTPVSSLGNRTIGTLSITLESSNVSIHIFGVPSLTSALLTFSSETPPGCRLNIFLLPWSSKNNFCCSFLKADRR